MTIIIHMSIYYYKVINSIKHQYIINNKAIPKTTVDLLFGAPSYTIALISSLTHPFIQQSIFYRNVSYSYFWMIIVMLINCNFPVIGFHPITWYPKVQILLPIFSIAINKSWSSCTVVSGLIFNCWKKSFFLIPN